jgi:hypothetical protein
MIYIYIYIYIYIMKYVQCSSVPLALLIHLANNDFFRVGFTQSFPALFEDQSL